MAKKYPSFNYSNCLSCGICVQECPLSCLSMTRVGKHGKYVNVFPELCSQTCLGCGRCANSCPMNIISMVENEN